jgi:hypothetical protein
MKNEIIAGTPGGVLLFRVALRDALQIDVE